MSDRPIRRSSALNSYVFRTVRSGFSAAQRLDPGLTALRATAVGMAATLAAYGSALLLEHTAHLHVDILIQAVALTLTLSRAGSGTGVADRLIALAVLPPLAVAAAETSRLMAGHRVAGDAVFTVLLAATIAVRRFGPRATRAGTLAVLPLVAVLIVQVPGVPPAGHGQDLWAALVALIAASWGLTARWAAERTGFTRPHPPAYTPPARAGGGRRPSASTRMSLQMAGAVGAAFVAGHAAFAEHWTWAVLTAFVVCSGARGRADVLHKGVLRTAGAAAGTAAATLIAGTFGVHDHRTVVVIFIVLAAATWLRHFGYAYWAGCVTAVLALLYGYFGQSAPGLLGTRLEAIAVGAVLGVAAFWLILPIRSADVLRRRTADALAVLGDFLAAARREPARLADDQARFDAAVRRLEQIAGPLRAHRALHGLHHPGRSHPADAIDAVRRCAAPVHAIARCAAEHHAVLDAPGVLRMHAAVAADLTRARLAVGRRTLPGPPPPARDETVPAAPESPADRVRAALTDLDAALRTLQRIFVPARG
ncbi:FUSC family protein [Actinoallomurus soli]|uniref:FUSC family protein n=1 Tax=Actinoallomurus soli TaxID=2952535 RepID=UPI0020933ADF|nr:FUSC family protein [Actinoallomurus soli]MCO5972362.1 FUSC family protein [Actinoallomurus soli]